MNDDLTEMITKSDLQELRTWVIKREIKAIWWFAYIMLGFWAMILFSAWVLVNVTTFSLNWRMDELLSRLAK
jgi:hypothetical protein